MKKCSCDDARATIDMPPASRRSLLLVRLGLPFFYGYVVLVVATFGKIMSAPGQSPCIGVVVDCLMSSLGLSRSTTSALYLVATVGSAASLPKVGSLVDKFGVQKSVGLVSILLGGACFLLSVCSNAVLLLLCFYLLRLLGQGAIFLVSQNAINLWFVRLRGLVMGLAAAGATLGITSLSPSLMQTGLATIGWRRMYVMLGFVCLGFSLVGFAFYREAPEQYGLLPDGDKPKGLAASDSAAEMATATEAVEGAAPGAAAEAPAATDAAATAEGEPAWTRAEALRTPAFWSVSVGCLSVALTGTAFWFHLNRVLTDQLPSFAAEPPTGNNLTSSADSACGVQPQPGLMSSIYTTLAISSTIARVVSGALADRVQPRYLLAAALLLQGLSLALTPLSSTFALLEVVCILQGVSQAVLGAVASIVYANFYGRKHLGAIGGVGKAMVVLGSALGPFPFGAVHDVTGSFDAAFVAGAVLSLVCCVLALRYGAAPVRVSGRKEGPAVELQAT